MPLTFVDGEVADNVCKTYLINIFKEEKDLLNLYGLGEIKNLFAGDLNNFVAKIFGALKKLDDIKSAKWAIRLVSLLADENLSLQIFDLLEQLYAQKRAKEAKYFIECLIYAKNNKVIELIKRLTEQNTEAFLNDKNYFISLYTELNGVKDSDIQDLLVNENVTDEVLAVQKERLYKNFIANKAYTKEQFKDTFINKKVFNTLAQNLVFGEYKQNRLLNLFVL